MQSNWMELSDRHAECACGAGNSRGFWRWGSLTAALNLGLTVLLLPLSTPALAAPAVPQQVTGHLKPAGPPLRVVLAPLHTQTLSIWNANRLLWQGVPAAWQPWKLMCADVDGDGADEVLLGLHKRTHFYKWPHNCLFVYGWNGRSLVPRWRGSSLGRNFSDFITRSRGRQTQLLALQTRADGTRCVAAFSWNYFGFVLNWEYGRWKKAGGLHLMGQQAHLTADGHDVTLPLR